MDVLVGQAALSQKSIVLILSAFVAVVAACGQPQEGDYARVVSFDSATIRVHSAGNVTRFRVELAESPEQRTMGLMERMFLPDSGGMLFLYDRDEPADAGFWMYRTRLPLDIAFLDSSGIVVAVRHMEPCAASLTSGCPNYVPGVPYRAALEVNAGVFARHGIGIGARVELPSRPSMSGS